METLDLSLDELLTTTRAVRKRLDLDRTVEGEVVEECPGIAMQAPTGSNAQGRHWVVVTDADLKAEIAEVYRAGAQGYLPQDPPPGVDQQSRVVSSARYLADTLGTDFRPADRKDLHDVVHRDRW